MEKSRKVLVRVIVSKGAESFHMRALLSGIIRVGDEFVVDDETTGEAHPVQVTSIESGDKRLGSAQVEDIKTVWARAIEEVAVKISIPLGEITESIEMQVQGDMEFVIGEKIKINNRELEIKQIKIREGSFKRLKGIAIKAKNIKRIYADAGIRKTKKIFRGGGRVVIKKRESVWSLKYKKTD